MSRSLRLLFAFLVVVTFFFFRASPAAAEERAPDRGVPLMTTGAALFGASYGVSLAIGVTATAAFTARCSGGGSRSWGEVFYCLEPPATIHLMVPIAGPFQTLAETRNADAADRALLIADGVAQITGVVLAGIGMAQYLDGRAHRAQPPKSAVRVVPNGPGLVVLGTF